MFAILASTGLVEQLRLSVVFKMLAVLLNVCQLIGSNKLKSNMHCVEVCVSRPSRWLKIDNVAVIFEDFTELRSRLPVSTSESV